MEEIQFEKGQIVVYGTNGICVVDDIELMSFATGMPKEEYYVLRQHRNKDNRFFVPVRNSKLTAKMREPMQKEDIEDILMGFFEGDVEWICDRRGRNEYFKEILHDGVSMKLLSMIKCIYDKKRQLTKEGKKLPVADTNILKTAEKLMEEEFSWVLEIDAKEVSPFIRKRLHIPEEE